MKRLLLLVLLAAVVACASSPADPRAQALPNGIPLEVDNRSMDDVVIYLVTGSIHRRVGRAPGSTTTVLFVPRTYANLTVWTVVRWPLTDRYLSSPEFVLPADGVTIRIDPRDVGIGSARS